MELRAALREHSRFLGRMAIEAWPKGPKTTPLPKPPIDLIRDQSGLPFSVQNLSQKQTLGSLLSTIGASVKKPVPAILEVIHDGEFGVRSRWSRMAATCQRRSGGRAADIAGCFLRTGCFEETRAPTGLEYEERTALCASRVGSTQRQHRIMKGGRASARPEAEGFSTRRKASSILRGISYSPR